MTRKTKKISMGVLVAIFVVALLFALFTVFAPLGFFTAAAAQDGYTTYTDACLQIVSLNAAPKRGFGKMTLKLSVSDKAFESEENHVARVVVRVGDASLGFYDDDLYSNIGKPYTSVFVDEFYGAYFENVATFGDIRRENCVCVVLDKEDFTNYDENLQRGSIELDVCARVSASVSIKASVHQYNPDTGELSFDGKYEATAKRDYLTALDAAVEADKNIESASGYIKQLNDFRKEEKTAFNISDELSLVEYNNAEITQKLLLNIPTKLQEELKKDEVFVTCDTPLFFRPGYYLKKMLVITRAWDRTGYENGGEYLKQSVYYSQGAVVPFSGLKMYTGEGYENYFFSLCDDDSFGNLSYTFLDNEYEVTPLLMNNGSTVAEVNIPVTASCVKDHDYVYYAQVVNVLHAFGHWTTYISGTGMEHYDTFYFYDQNQRSVKTNVTSIKSSVTEMLEHSSYYNWDSTTMQSYLGLVGQYAGDRVYVRVRYKENRSYNGIEVVDREESPDSMILPVEYAYSPALALNHVMASGYLRGPSALSGFLEDLRDFNVVCRSTVEQKNYQVPGENDPYNTGDEIVLQAMAVQSTYDIDNETVTLEILYSDFLEKDFSIFVTDTNNTYKNWKRVTTPRLHYEEDVYISGYRDENHNFIEGYTGTVVKFIFLYDELLQYLQAVQGWFLDEGSLDFTWNEDLKKKSINVAWVSDCSKYLGVNESSENPRSGLVVSCPTSRLNDLINANVRLLANVTEDYAVTTYVEYDEVTIDENKELVTTIKRVPVPYCTTYSRSLLLSYNNIIENFGNEIGAGVKTEGLYGTYKTAFTAVRRESIEEDEKTGEEIKVVTFRVRYNANPVFKVSVGGGTDVRYVAADKQGLTYYGDDLFPASLIPQGNRVLRFDRTEGDTRVRVENRNNYEKSEIILSGVYLGEIIPITVVLTDAWTLDVTYMQPWTTSEWSVTPFATKKTTRLSVELSDLPDLNNTSTLETNDVAKLLGYENRNAMKICNIAIPNDKAALEVKDAATYSVTLTYAPAYIKSIGVDGEARHLNVPLTSFTEWAHAFWSSGKPNVMMLNTGEKRFFNVGDVMSEDVYGYFGTALFDTKVSDLNSHFKKNTGDGCMTLYSTKEVKGSTVYKFFDSMRGKGIISKLVGEICMAFCELVNQDDVVQYSHFFYLDGSEKDVPYISIGGADSSDDKDSAIENAGQDVGAAIGATMDEIKKWWDEKTQGWKDSTAAKVIGIALGVLFACAVVMIIIRIVRWAFKK